VHFDQPVKSTVGEVNVGLRIALSSKTDRSTSGFKLRLAESAVTFHEWGI